MDEVESESYSILEYMNRYDDDGMKLITNSFHKSEFKFLDIFTNDCSKIEPINLRAYSKCEFDNDEASELSKPQAKCEITGKNKKQKHEKKAKERQFVDFVITESKSDITKKKARGRKETTRLVRYEIEDEFSSEVESVVIKKKTTTSSKSYGYDLDDDFIVCSSSTESNDSDSSYQD